MKTSGKLGQRTLLASACITFLLLLIAGITNRMLVNQRDISAAHERRYQSYLLADQLRQSSDDLTRLARTYVVTGDARFEGQYWAVLDIRNGKTPRPLHYERIYWDFMAVEGAGPRAQDKAVALQQLMKEQGFTEGEFAKLKEAQDNSDGLVQIETVAMNAVKGLFADGKGGYTRKGAPDLEMARQLMHGRDYHAEKARIMKPIDEFLGMLDQRTSGEVQVLEQHGHRLFQVLLATVGLSLLTLVVLCFSIFRTVIAPIQRVMADLSLTSHELDAASAQLARSSHTLSSAASEQAASVEETSASLEELSSMIQSTAGQAQNAKSLAAETRQDAEGGSRTMVEMVGAMAEIDASSAQVAKIVKDIDELAFQTNILALNAAVEAARAGEAGAGFAVVADEVRSLAQRSAAAARETADKIEAAMATSRKGSVSTTRVGESLRQILERVAATDSVVAGMATAAREQALGIQQINQAIEQIDKASQLNASNAEETAAAAEQVDAQGEALIELVDRLRQLVGGATSPGSPVDPSAPDGRPRSTLVVHAGPEAGPAARRAAEAKPRIGGPNPKELPSGTSGDDSEFRNF